MQSCCAGMRRLGVGARRHQLTSRAAKRARARYVKGRGQQHRVCAAAPTVPLLLMLLTTTHREVCRVHA